MLYATQGHRMIFSNANIWHCNNFSEISPPMILSCMQHSNVKNMSFQNCSTFTPPENHTTCKCQVRGCRGGSNRYFVKSPKSGVLYRICNTIQYPAFYRTEELVNFSISITCPNIGILIKALKQKLLHWNRKCL